jgi:hypothetical protein
VVNIDLNIHHWACYNGNVKQLLARDDIDEASLNAAASRLLSNLLLARDDIDVSLNLNGGTYASCSNELMASTNIKSRLSNRPNFVRGRIIVETTHHDLAKPFLMEVS